MDWRDIACIVFACTAVNHLELIKTIEGIIKREIPVVNCPKCLTFWSVLAYGIYVSEVNFQDIAFVLPRLLAISLLCSYLAIWLELIMYAIDTLYNRIYGILEENNEEDLGEGSTDGE